jgi:hypothetical protein
MMFVIVRRPSTTVVAAESESGYWTFSSFGETRGLIPAMWRSLVRFIAQVEYTDTTPAFQRAPP